MFAASHSNYSVQPFMVLLLLSVLYSVQLQLYNVQYILLVYHHVCVDCGLTQLSLCSLLTKLFVFASALFLSAAYVITDQICKFRIPGL